MTDIYASPQTKDHCNTWMLTWFKIKVLGNLSTIITVRGTSTVPPLAMPFWLPSVPPPQPPLLSCTPLRSSPTLYTVPPLLPCVLLPPPPYSLPHLPTPCTLPTLLLQLTFAILLVLLMKHLLTSTSHCFAKGWAATPPQQDEEKDGELDMAGAAECGVRGRRMGVSGKRQAA